MSVPPIIRRVLGAAVRLLVALALLAWLVRSGRLDPAALLDLDPTAAQWTLLAAAGLAVALGLLALALRLQLLLRATGLDVGYWRSVHVIVLGALSATFLPGLVGSDVVRATTLCRGISQGRRRAIGAVMVDRVVGIYALFLVAAAAIALGAGTGTLPELPPTVVALPWIIGLGAPIGLYLVLALMPWIVRRAPEHLIAKVEPLTICLRYLAASPRLVLGVIGLGMLNHSLVILTYIAADRVLGSLSTLLEHAILDPLAFALNALPISPGGLGVSESLFSYLFAEIGNPNGAAIGMVGRIVQYAVVALAGGIAMVVSTGSPADTTAEKGQPS